MVNAKVYINETDSLTGDMFMSDGNELSIDIGTQVLKLRWTEIYKVIDEDNNVYYGGNTPGRHAKKLLKIGAGAIGGAYLYGKKEIVQLLIFELVILMI